MLGRGKTVPNTERESEIGTSWATITNGRGLHHCTEVALTAGRVSVRGDGYAPHLLTCRQECPTFPSLLCLSTGKLLSPKVARMCSRRKSTIELLHRNCADTYLLCTHTEHVRLNWYCQSTWTSTHSKLVPQFASAPGCWLFQAFYRHSLSASSHYSLSNVLTSWC